MTNIVLLLGIPVFGILCLFLTTFVVLGITASVTGRPNRYSDQPPVSVIIPAYNEETLIQQCVTSFRRATYPEDRTEIIVVDDGSTDKTRKLVDECEATLIQQDHAGKVAALNNAYQHATNNIIIVADADTTVNPSFLNAITTPFSNEAIGAVSGAVTPLHQNTALKWFQTVEYYYNNYIRRAVSTVFSTDIWFFGCIAAYRRQALEDIDGFPADSLTEDMDIVMRMRQEGWRAVHAANATGKTKTPDTVSELSRQRRRWWGGGYQLLSQHKSLFGDDATFTFITLHHWWWAVYATLSIPLLAYQFAHWLPTGILEISFYTFRWFTLLGPVAVIYNIPAGWLSWYNVFGVASGLLTTGLILAALYTYEKGFTATDAVALFLYFPYTILLNTFILLGVWEATKNPRNTYIR